MDDDYAMMAILIVGLTILGGVLLWITIVSGAVTRLPILCSQRGSMMSDVVGRIGRPTKDPVDGERVQLGLRVTAGVKRRLDTASVESGRSLSQETEMRLKQSFLPVMTLRDFFAGQMLAGAAPAPARGLWW